LVAIYQTFSTFEDLKLKSKTSQSVRWTLAQNITKTYSSVLHSHTVLLKLCPCGRYRQPNCTLLQ